MLFEQFANSFTERNEIEAGNRISSMKALFFTLLTCRVFSWCRCNILEFDVLARSRKEIITLQTKKSQDDKNDNNKFDNFFDSP